MIFLTVGTHEPFDRLVRAVDEWCGTTGHGPEVFGQIIDPGSSGYRPQNFEWTARLTPEAYQGKFASADFVISHAGMGSIITALTLSKPIVVLPRRGHLNETRNDHQYATVSRLASKAGLFVAEDETQLPGLLDQMMAGAGKCQTEHISPFAEESLTDALSRFIHGR